MSLASLEWGRAASGGRKRGFRGFVVDMPLLLILLGVVALGIVVENGGGGARAAAPVARKVLDAFFAGESYVAREP